MAPGVIRTEPNMKTLNALRKLAYSAIRFLLVFVAGCLGFFLCYAPLTYLLSGKVPGLFLLIGVVGTAAAIQLAKLAENRLPRL